MIRCVATRAALAAGLALLPLAAHSAPHHAAAGGINVMRGDDTQNLIAMLPWWRLDPSQPRDPGELESPILTACDVWLGFPYATTEAQSLTVRLAAIQQASEVDHVADRIKVVDPGELNEIDLTAPPEEPPVSGPPWLLRGVLALIGGAVAAFSAVRYLVA